MCGTYICPYQWTYLHLLPRYCTCSQDFPLCTGKKNTVATAKTTHTSKQAYVFVNKNYFV